MGRRKFGVHIDVLGLKTGLIRARMTQRALALAIGIGETTLSSALYGRGQVSHAEAQRAAEVLGVSVESLVRKVEE
jgi:transcriptional regulator with XRE-family HTH domain